MDQELEKGLLTLKIVWIAMLASLAMYLFVGLLVSANIKSSLDADTFKTIKTVLYAAAPAVMFATRFVRNLVLSRKGRQTQPNPAFPNSTLQKYVSATIVALAMSESIGIFGLVLFFLGKNLMDLYLLLLISAAAMFIYRPRKEEMAGMMHENSRYS